MANEKKVVQCDVVIEEKSFVNEQGERVRYTDLTLMVCDVPIKVKVNQSDKSLLNYLLNDL